MTKAARARPSFEFVLDRDWRIASISQDAAAWSGSTPEALTGRDSRDVWGPESEAMTRAVEAAFAARESSTLEKPSLMVPGRWLRVDVEPAKQGARVRYEDITSRIGLGAGPAEIVVLDRKGVIVAANTAWRTGAALLGLELADAGVGAPYVKVAKAIVPRTNEAALQSRLEELFSGQLAEFEATFSQDAADHLERR
jgi:PAS domain-containing protein